MKNYKFLVPIVAIVLFIASVYMLYSAKAEEEEQYNHFLTVARDFRSQEILGDAESNYMSALSIKPSFDLYIEIGEFFWESGQTRDAINWGNTIVSNYPKQAEGYEFLMDLYIQKEDYIECFGLFETMGKRKVSSNIVDELIFGIEYEYFFNGEYTDVGIYSGGLCPVQSEGSWGYVNLSGDKVGSIRFTKVGYFSGDLAPVIDSDGEAYFIDTDTNKKKVILGIENIKELGLIENGLFSLYNGSEWGFYNSDNEHVFGSYDDVSSIGNGIAAVKENGKWSLVDREGTDLTGAYYDDVIADEKQIVYRNERLFVCHDLNYYMIDASGNVISDLVFEDAKIFNDSSYAAIKINGKWGFIDKDGNITIEPQYEDARSFLNGLAAVKISGKWGFIGMDENVAITPQFDDAKDFNSSGGVFVSENGVWKLLRLYKYNY